MPTRRDFLKQSLAFSASLPFVNPGALHPFQAQPGFFPEIGLQLYTVRHQMQEDPAGTLQRIADIGYKQIEGGNLPDIPKLLPALQNSGLLLQSTSFPLAILTGRWDLAGSTPFSQSYTDDQLIEDAMNNNLKYLTISYIHPEERKNWDDFKTLIDQINAFGEKCNQADINLCYHNHAFEFEPTDGTTPFDFMVKNFEVDTVSFELDVFWVTQAGHDPIELLNRLDGRVKLMHLKDRRKGARQSYVEKKVKDSWFVPVGSGTLDIPAILETAEQVGVEQCFVEQDHAKNPWQSIDQSYQYLKKLAGV